MEIVVADLADQKAIGDGRQQDQPPERQTHNQQRNTNTQLQDQGQQVFHHALKKPYDPGKAVPHLTVVSRVLDQEPLSTGVDHGFLVQLLAVFENPLTGVGAQFFGVTGQLPVQVLTSEVTGQGQPGQDQHQTVAPDQQGAGVCWLFFSSQVYEWEANRIDKAVCEAHSSESWLFMTR